MVLIPINVMKKMHVYIMKQITSVNVIIHILNSIVQAVNTMIAKHATYSIKVAFSYLTFNVGIMIDAMMINTLIMGPIVIVIRVTVLTVQTVLRLNLTVQKNNMVRVIIIINIVSGMKKSHNVNAIYMNISIVKVENTQTVNFVNMKIKSQLIKKNVFPMKHIVWKKNYIITTMVYAVVHKMHVG